MADHSAPPLPMPSNEDQQIAARDFEYANRAAVGGNYDLAIQMLRTSCRLVPGNLAYRQALRKVEKTRYKKGRRAFLAPLTTAFRRFKLWRASQREDYRKVLEHGEAVLAKDPWNKAVHLHMAEAASQLHLPILAIWILQEIREKNPMDVQVNRALARLLEKEGHFTQAMHLWELVRKAIPTDQEATIKAKQMAVSETLVRGNYEEKIIVDPATPDADKPTPTPPPMTTKASPKDRTAQEMAALREQIDASPTIPEPYLQLATNLTRKGKLEEALAVLEQGLQATDNAIELQLAKANLEIEPYRKALAQNEEKLAEHPDDEKLLKTREKIRKKLNTLELAYYRQKAEHDPAEKATRFELGVRLWRAGHAEEAIRELQAARSEGRLQWQAMYYLGHCFKSRQNWPLARRNFEESLKLLPESEVAHKKELLFELASGHAEVREFERAVELALDLADLDYAYRGIGRLLEEWQEQGKKNGTPTKRL